MNKLFVYGLGFSLPPATSLSIGSAVSSSQIDSHAEAYWVSVAGGIGVLKGPGVTLGSDLAFQHRDLVLGIRYVYYRVTGVYEHPTDLGSPPSPGDYNSEVAILI